MQNAMQAQVLFKYIRANGACRVERIQKVQTFLRDTLTQLPVTSVGVEVQHANLQRDNPMHRAGGRRPLAVHVNSYILSARMEHSRVKNLVEEEVLGGKPSMLKRMVRSGGRVLQSSQATSVSLRTKKPGYLGLPACSNVNVCIFGKLVAV